MARRIQADTASQLASDLYKLARHEAEMASHLDDFGSGHECGGLVGRSSYTNRVEFWRMWKRRTHMNKKKLVQFLKDRTTSKFCHFVLEI